MGKYRNKEAIMDSIIEVFKQREDWCTEEARINGVNPEPTFKAQKAYDLAFQALGGNSFRPGWYQKSKADMQAYLERQKQLFVAAMTNYYRARVQWKYLGTEAGKAEERELSSTINMYRQKNDEVAAEFCKKMSDFLEKNSNCEYWRLSRYGVDRVTFALVELTDDNSTRLSEDSAVTFYIERTNGENPTINVSAPGITKFSCEEPNTQVVRYAWIGLLMLNNRLSDLKSAMLEYSAKVKYNDSKLIEYGKKLENMGLTGENFEEDLKNYINKYFKL